MNSNYKGSKQKMDEMEDVGAHQSNLVSQTGKKRRNVPFYFEKEIIKNKSAGSVKKSNNSAEEKISEISESDLQKCFIMEDFEALICFFCR